jgi:hypothetical protein
MPIEEIDRIAEKPLYIREKFACTSMSVPVSHIRRRIVEEGGVDGRDESY